MVLVTVRSLGSALMTFSYSTMAFCILPCWTYFSAALSTFCLLNPKPNAIRLRTPALVANDGCANDVPGALSGKRHIGQTPFLEMAGWNKCNCTAGRVESHGYQGLP